MFFDKPVRDLSSNLLMFELPVNDETEEPATQVFALFTFAEIRVSL